MRLKSKTPSRKAINKKYLQKRRVKNPKYILFHNARTHARRKGLEFSIKGEDIVLPENCPCCGVRFLISAAPGRSKGNLPSLDRLNSNKGYVPGNVNVICYTCNNRKNDSSVTDIFRIANWMLSKQPNGIDGEDIDLNTRI